MQMTSQKLDATTLLIQDLRDTNKLLQAYSALVLKRNGLFEKLGLELSSYHLVQQRNLKFVCSQIIMRNRARLRRISNVHKKGAR